MTLSIRDPRAADLARELARRLGTTMTEAVISALTIAIEADSAKIPLAQRVAKIADDLALKAQSGGCDLTQEAINALWGH